MSDALRQARIDLAAAYRLAERMGLSEGICNHFTLEVPGERDRFLVIPYGTHWSEVTASKLIVVDAEGRTVEGEGAIEATAFFIHSTIHQARPDAACVLHTHQPFATAIASLRQGRVEPAVQSALRFHGRIAYDDRYNGLVSDAAEGRRIVTVLGDKPVLFLANHGVLCAAPTVAQAFDDLYFLERACQTLVYAMSTGRPLALVPDEMAREVAKAVSTDVGAMVAHFEALKRGLDRDVPAYRD